MKMLKKLGFIALAVFAFKANAQTDKATTARIVAEKTYIFVATSAMPLNATDINNVLSKMPGGVTGGSINLTGSAYDVKVTPDSIVAYLPYYGRSYSAPLNRDDNGFKFTSKDNKYTVVKRKKGWDVSIETKDTKESPRLNLNISENGYGTLSITSNNKQSISYNGYLKEVPKKD